jgi:predicted TIM-barrel fold metal-dependent hydrolase
MSTRREFLQRSATAGLCFVGCGIAAPRHAHAQGTRRGREVLVSGKRARTIDIHAHCMIPEAQAAAGEATLAAAGPITTKYPGLQLADDRVKIMDEQGIDMEALSINPIWYALERDVAEKVIEIQNEKLAAFSAAHPERFVAFASVALQYPDLAVAQLEKAIRRQGLRGVAVGGSVNGVEFADPKFHPFWAKCEELGILVFIHPLGTPQLRDRLKGNGLLSNVIGNPLETTLALSHLIFEGTLDKFPGLKICAAHGGGYLGSYGPRSDHGCLVFPEQCDKGIVLRKKPTEYLKQIYVDNIVFTPEAMRHLGAEIGYERIMLGSDYPYPWEDRAVDVILSAPGATDAQKLAMLGGTAAKLLGIDPR